MRIVINRNAHRGGFSAGLAWLIVGALFLGTMCWTILRLITSLNNIFGDYHRPEGPELPPPSRTNVVHTFEMI